MTSVFNEASQSTAVEFDDPLVASYKGLRLELQRVIHLVWRADLATDGVAEAGVLRELSLIMAHPGMDDLWTPAEGHETQLSYLHSRFDSFMDILVKELETLARAEPLLLKERFVLEPDFAEAYAQRLSKLQHAVKKLELLSRQVGPKHLVLQAHYRNIALAGPGVKAIGAEARDDLFRPTARLRDCYFEKPESETLERYLAQANLLITNRLYLSNSVLSNDGRARKFRLINSYAEKLEVMSLMELIE